jgi:hypothetical protein
MEEEDKTIHPREDDRNEELDQPPAPDPDEEYGSASAEEDPEAD